MLFCLNSSFSFFLSLKKKLNTKLWLRGCGPKSSLYLRWFWTGFVLISLIWIVLVPIGDSVVNSGVPQGSIKGHLLFTPHMWLCSKWWSTSGIHTGTSSIHITYCMLPHCNNLFHLSCFFCLLCVSSVLIGSFPSPSLSHSSVSWLVHSLHLPSATPVSLIVSCRSPVVPLYIVPVFTVSPVCLLSLSLVSLSHSQSLFPCWFLVFFLQFLSCQRFYVLPFPKVKCFLCDSNLESSLSLLLSLTPGQTRDTHGHHTT